MDRQRVSLDTTQMQERAGCRRTTLALALAARSAELSVWREVVLADGKVVLRVWKQCLRCLQITEGLDNVLQPINCTK